MEARDLASAKIAQLRRSLGTLTRAQKLAAAGFGAAALGGTAAAYELSKFGISAIKSAAQFQQSNTLLTTQAGVMRSRIAGLADEFVGLAPKFGTTAAALSAAFYHVASAGVPVRDQLATLKAAAQGAAIGNANLEDTTNALVAVLRSGIGGIHGARDAMATLLAIVGTGNMRLQDFVAAMGTGLPGAAATFGVSIQSAGAALAYLTDTGMGARQASTRLAMAIALLGGPSQQASKLLHALGLSSSDIHTRFGVVTQMLQKAGLSFSKLASDMRKPDGIVVALRDLKRHMNEVGMNAQLQAAFVARAFGGGHMGKAIMQLFESLGKVGQKFGAINRGAGSFGEHWRQTTQTAAFQAKQLHAAMNSISLSIGEALLPAVQKLAAAIVPIVTRISEWTNKHKTLAAVIFGSLLAFSVLIALIGMLGLAFMALNSAAAPWLLIALAIIAALAAIAFGIKEVIDHWKSWGKWVAFALAAVVPFIGLPILIYKYWRELPRWAREIWDDLRTYFFVITARVLAEAESQWSDFKGWLSTLWGDIENLVISVWGDIASFFGGVWSEIRNTVLDVWNAITGFLTGVWDGIKSIATTVWNAIVGFFSTVWDGLVTAWNASWNAIKVALQAVWSALSVAASAVWKALKTAALATWDGLQLAWTASWNAIHGAIDAVWRDIQGSAKTVWGALRSFFDAIWNGVQAAYTGTWSAIHSAVDAVWGQIESSAKKVWGAVRDVVGAVWNGLSAVWRRAWTALWDVVRGFVDKIINGLNFLIRGWDSLSFHTPGLKVLGHTIVPSISFSVPKVGQIPKLQSGGIVLDPTLALIGEAGPEAVIPLGSLGGFGGGGSQQVIFDFRGSQVMSDADLDRLTQRIGKMLTTFGLPAAGMQVRRI